MSISNQNHRKLPITRAAVLLLREAQGRPLHYAEIAKAALERNLIAVSDRNVVEHVATSLYRHIRKAGEGSWLRRIGPGKFELTEAGAKAEVWHHTPRLRSHLSPDELAGVSGLTWREAAEVVLHEAGRPLHASDIVERAWARGLRPCRPAKWTARSMTNLLAQEVRNSRRRGRRPKFQRIAPGVYALADSRTTYSRTKTAAPL